MEKWLLTRVILGAWETPDRDGPAYHSKHVKEFPSEPEQRGRGTRERDQGLRGQ